MSSHAALSATPSSVTQPAQKQSATSTLQPTQPTDQPMTREGQQLGAAPPSATMKKQMLMQPDKTGIPAPL